MSSVIEKMLSRIKPSKRRGKELGDLGMIADELAEALMSDNAKGVADSLRAAFACMSDDNAKGYAKGGMVKEEEEEWDGSPETFYADDDDDNDEEDDKNPSEDEEYPLSEEGHIKELDEITDEELNHFLNQKGIVDSQGKITSWDPSSVGDFFINPDEKVEQNPDYYNSLTDYQWDDEYYISNTSNEKMIRKLADSFDMDIGDDFDIELKATLFGDPYKYVEIKSDPAAYSVFLDRLKSYKVPEGTPEDEYYKGLRAMIMGDDFANEVESKRRQLSAEQQRALGPQQPKRELVEMVDPDTETTHLVDNPQKVLRRAPKAKPKRKLPSMKPIQMGPLR